MGDFNTVTLTGKLVRPSLKDQGAHTFFKMKVQADPTSDAFPVGVSCYVTKKEREAFESIIQRCEEGPVDVVIQNGFESGTLKEEDGEKKFMFYDVSAKLSNITLLQGKVDTPMNLSQVSGEVLEAGYDEEHEGSHVIIGSKYFRRDPRSEDAKGEWADRYIRLFIPNSVTDTVPEIGKRVVVMGTVAEKLGEVWHHHVCVSHISYAE